MHSKSIITNTFTCILICICGVLTLFYFKYPHDPVNSHTNIPMHNTTPERLKMPLYVAAILEQDKKFFLIQRKNTNWAEGYWNFPGGLVDPHETIMQAVIRETQEEVGVTVQAKDFEQVHVLHVRKTDTNPQDIIGIYFKATKWTGTPHNAENHKITEAKWFVKDELPSKLTKHAQLIIQGMQTGSRYSEEGWQ